MNIDMLNPDEARKMLGAYLTIDGNNDIKVRVMRKKAELWREWVQVGYLSRYMAWILINTTIWKIM